MISWLDRQRAGSGMSWLYWNKLTNLWNFEMGASSKLLLLKEVESEGACSEEECFGSCGLSREAYSEAYAPAPP